MITSASISVITYNLKVGSLYLKGGHSVITSASISVITYNLKVGIVVIKGRSNTSTVGTADAFCSYRDLIICVSSLNIYIIIYMQHDNILEAKDWVNCKNCKNCKTLAAYCLYNYIRTCEEFNYFRS